MDDLIITFNSVEANILLNWCEIANVRSERFGTSRYYFPQEDIVIEKLRKMNPATKFDDMDFEIMWGWMEKSVYPRVGEGGVYFPNEEEMVEKLNHFRRKIERVNSLTRQKVIIKDRIEAIEHSSERHDFKYDADQFRQKLKDKKSLKTTDEQISEVDEKIDKIHDKYDEGIEQKKDQENRSFDDKTKAAHNLKDDLKNTYKKLFSKNQPQDKK